MQETCQDLGGPGVGVDPALAHADESWLGGKAMLSREEGIPGIPRFAGIRGNESDVEAPVEQIDFGLRREVPIASPPGPRIAGGGLFGDDHDAAPLAGGRGLDSVPSPAGGAQGSISRVCRPS